MNFCLHLCGKHRILILVRNFQQKISASKFQKERRNVRMKTKQGIIGSSAEYFTNIFANYFETYIHNGFFDGIHAGIRIRNEIRDESHNNGINIFSLHPIHVRSFVRKAG